MYCMVCQHDLIDCTCPDIEERLNALKDIPSISIAAKQNQWARKVMNTERETEKRH